MKVLVTGASGVFGRAVMERLAMEGHEAIGTSRRRPKYMPSGADWIPADIRDEIAVEKAMAGCEAVVHMAWTLAPLETRDATREVDVGGTVNVMTAMERTGCDRLVFCSSVMAYGASPLHPDRLLETDERRPAENHGYSLDKRDCEDLIMKAGVNALLVRPSVVAGRTVDNTTLEGLALPAIPTIKGVTSRMQFVHPDDIGRFFALACTSSLAGPVNLGSDDVITLDEVAEILGRRTVAVSEKVLRGAARMAMKLGLMNLDPGSFDALVNFPIVDTTKLREEFGFRCAWTSREAVNDLRRASERFMFLGSKRVDMPWRLAYPTRHAPDNVPTDDGVELVPASSPELAGEFDSLIDPRLGTYTAANLSEAFAGPLTPLTLEYAASAMRKGGQAIVDLIDPPEPLASYLRYRPVGVFGHDLYGNLSVIHEMVRAMPGMDSEELWDDALFGGIRLEESVVSIAPLGPAAAAKQGARSAGKLAGFSTEIDRVEAEDKRLCIPESQLAEISDATLGSRLLLLKDVVESSWSVATTGTAIATQLSTQLDKLRPGASAAIRHGTEHLASAGPIRAVQHLAGLIKTNPVVSTIVDTEDPETVLARIRVEAPQFAAALDQAIAEHGHRGPRETELANKVFADDPAQFLSVVAKHLKTPPPPAPEPVKLPVAARPLARLLRHFQHERERARDALVRLTHAYRQTVRERARRLVDAGVLDQIDDAYYLLSTQLVCPPKDAQEVVARRRAERQRLAALDMPITFQDRWEPIAEEHQPLRTGETLEGLSAAVGKVSGPVRVLTIDTVADLEPGEILVAHLTDTGWTPLFACASAVVTDIGGPMSHAAVVAREYGIPCVVHAGDATHRLRTGQLVEVDGAAGTVTALED